MKSNPCRRCEKAFVWKNRHMPNTYGKHAEECRNCEKRKAHNKYLESQRKYEEGEQITSLDELSKQEWVMWFHTIRHIEVIKHTQLATVLNWLDRGAFRKAIKKEV